ncbi:hypothetical protein SAMN05421820_11628 [Pedobacter steynii]|uniref:Methyltransferase n=1 Tax=Pedobacter steynii TaxID=430522 RepID=A0A1H0KEH7_9SPHI|nr:hypothetical protein SAMN05421820_11628 [Pedobacter steynii]
MYIHFHQEDYLVDGLKVKGFEIVNLQRKDYLMQEGAGVTDLIIIAKKRS